MSSKRVSYSTLIDVLEFYANPDTYFAIGFMADRPAGDFTEDFSETELGLKPGKRAREILARLDAGDE
jgi:hypothetical protein